MNDLIKELCIEINGCVDMLLNDECTKREIIEWTSRIRKANSELRELLLEATK
jgi:hypothetical protein